MFDLIEILKIRVQAVPAGGHSDGLRSVLRHIEAAAARLERGWTTPDETEFNDTIYRTNQAFEGSLKEAYRVLAGKDPSKTTPHDVEQYLEKKNHLRPRVLKGLRNYRTLWRNPSTHDYNLVFDEDEALLAIVSVCAFAIVLIDQIVERLSFNAARSAAAAEPTTESSDPLVKQVVALLRQFANTSKTSSTKVAGLRAAELNGAIAGFLSAGLPKAEVLNEVPFGASFQSADVVVRQAQRKVLIEIKQVKFWRSVVERTLPQVVSFMRAAKIKDGILYFDPGSEEAELDIEERELFTDEGRVFILTPQESKSPTPSTK